MSKIFGVIMIGAGVVLIMLGCIALNAYRPEVPSYIYFGAAFSCLTGGIICYELGRCAEFLEKISKRGIAQKTSSSFSSEKIGENSSTSEIEDQNTKVCKNCGEKNPQSESRCSKCSWAISE